MLIGACFAAYVAVRLPGPGPLVLVAVLLLAALGGGLWAGIAALLKVWRNVPEVLTTLLLDVHRLSAGDVRAAQRVAARRSRQPHAPHQLRRTDPLRHAPPQRRRVREPHRLVRHPRRRRRVDRLVRARPDAARRPHRRARPQPAGSAALRRAAAAADRRRARGVGVLRRRRRRRAADRRRIRRPPLGRLLRQLRLGRPPRRPRRPQPRPRRDPDRIRVRRAAHGVELPRRHRCRPADDRRRAGAARARPADPAGDRAPRDVRARRRRPPEPTLATVDA